MAEQCKFEDLKATNIECPTCFKGTLEPSRGRFGPLYKCTAKGCGFYLETRPLGKKCKYVRDGKKCGSLIVEGTKTIPDRCSDKTCPNRNPHKLGK
jgi:hypothetical protein